MIRQHELLTAHVADHENLPLIAGNAVIEALAQAREEQQQRFDAALQAVENRGEAQEQRFQSELSALRQERSRYRTFAIGTTVVTIAAAVVAIVVQFV